MSRYELRSSKRRVSTDDEPVKPSSFKRKKHVVEDSESEKDQPLPDDESSVDEEYVDEDEVDQGKDQSDGDENEENDDEDEEQEDDEDEEEEDLEDDDQEEDWEQDDTMLRSFLYRGLKSQFPDLDEEKLKQTLVDVCSEAKDILTDFCQAKPKDTRWKTKVDAETVEKLEPILKKIREEIEKEEPTMDKILSAPLTDKERKDVVKLYDVYCNLEPYTFEYNQVRERLIKVLEMYSSHEESAQRQRVDEETAALLKKQPPTDQFGLKLRICQLETSEENKIKLLGLHRELTETSEESTAYRGIKERLEWAVSLPYNKIKVPEVRFGVSTPEEINAYCVLVKQRLDSSMYGMEKAKNALLAILANRIAEPGCTGMIGLKGPPGVGKTALGEAFATAIGLPFERVALGGLEDSTTLKGTESHWVGSSPSIVLQALRNMKVSNGIIAFDEIDKLSTTPNGRAAQDALLHITDYSQNNRFRDGFLIDVHHDLSKIWFFFMFNDYDRIDPVLRNRITNVVEVEPYSRQDLVHIITDFYLPKSLAKVGIPINEVSITEEACFALLSKVMPGMTNSGVRPIQDAVDKVVGNINVNRVCTLPDGSLGGLPKEFKIPGFKIPLIITPEIVNKFLEGETPKMLSYIS